jgi:UDP-N-acetylmuramoyl-L-alanyl-D-glutamate--2,6-diaminopimelate ligase
MTLEALIRDMDAKAVTGALDTEIKGVRFDSREVYPGDLFVALRGGRLDGRDFIGEAVRKGASAVVSEGEVRTGLPVPSVLVDDGREALASISNIFYGRPSEAMTVVGVTGTNGKTTTAYLLKSVLEAAGYKVGLTGTVGYQVGEMCHPAPHTTPEASVLQGLFREMLDAGCTHVVSEVSSHALAQKRVEHTAFKAAVFTNLTREHLDYHVTMDEYFHAKKRLFEDLLAGPAIINMDDPYGAKLLDDIKGDRLTFGIRSDADLTATGIEDTPGGLGFRLHFGEKDYSVASPLLGLVNVYNILASIGVAFALGLRWAHVDQGIRNVRRVAGRFEKVDLGQDFLCLVDYAHTEDALERLIANARELAPGRVITVFGCGGERDRGKRPAMGAVATGLSDLVFITSDNPRGEDPAGIIREIEAGTGKSNYSVVPDRGEAIKEAVNAARASDVVLIAGKGHEDYQEVKGRRHPFSDRAVAEGAVREVLKHG